MIADPDELTVFDSFSTTGIITTDTFNTWRKKDNGIIQMLSGFVESSGAESIAIDTALYKISLKDNGVNTQHITDGSITSQKIANLSVTEGKLGNLSVTVGKIADSAVTTAKIADANITTIKILDGNVTTGKIADNAVTTGKIADSAVTNGKIANLAVTNGKIAANAVTYDKILDGNVITSKLAYLAVTNDKIADGAVTVSKVGGGAITSSKLYGGTAYDAYRIYGVRAFGTVYAGGGFGYCSAEINTGLAPMGPYGDGVARVFFNWGMPVTGYSVMVTGLGNQGDHLFTVIDRTASYFDVQSIDTKMTNIIAAGTAYKDATQKPSADFGGFMFTIIF